MFIRREEGFCRGDELSIAGRARRNDDFFCASPRRLKRLRLKARDHLVMHFT
jgi:hypothetical protein